MLERDGWAPYRRFAHARHQSCLAHLLRRCRELVADADRGQARTPHAVRASLRMRSRSATPMTRAPWIGPASPPRQTASARRSTHWWPGHPLPTQPSAAQPPRQRTRAPVHVPARPWCAGHQLGAEQAIRPAVVTRKSWGGNRTRADADTWQVLTSVLRTATQQGRDLIELLTRLLQAPTPILADLAIPGH